MIGERSWWIGFLASWEEEANQILGRNGVPRVRMLGNPALHTEIALAEQRVGFSFTRSLKDFYLATNGFVIPHMDAEDGRILPVQELSFNVPAIEKMRGDFHASSPIPRRGWWQWFPQSELIRSVFITPIIDSAFYSVIGDEECHELQAWTWFNRGESCKFPSFAQMMIFERARILDAMQYLESMDAIRRT